MKKAPALARALCFRGRTPTSLVDRFHVMRDVLSTRLTTWRCPPWTTPKKGMTSHSRSCRQPQYVVHTTLDAADAPRARRPRALTFTGLTPLPSARRNLPTPPPNLPAHASAFHNLDPTLRLRRHRIHIFLLLVHPHPRPLGARVSAVRPWRRARNSSSQCRGPEMAARRRGSAWPRDETKVRRQR